LSKAIVERKEMKAKQKAKGWVRVTAAVRDNSIPFMDQVPCAIEDIVFSKEKSYTTLEIHLIVPNIFAEDIQAGLTKPLADCSAELIIDNIPTLLEQS
jgi:hypothetical protein